jgi:hypothetical protein
MKKRYIRALAMLLCVLMCVTLAPVEAFAYSDGAEEVVTENAVSNGKVKITSQPKSQTVNAGEKATFKVKATGKNLKYQWYYRKNSSSSWKKVSGGTKATLKVSAKGKNGYQYRCRVSSGAKKVYSKVAKLKVSNVKYRALLIGQTYASVYDVSTLVGDKDVALLKSALTEVGGPKGGKYSITSRIDASRSGIKSAIQNTFAKADSDDVSLFYYSGHGDASTTGTYAGSMVTVEGSGHGWLDLRDLAAWLKKVPGKVIVFIDSCGSGAAIYGNGTPSANAKAAAARFNQAVVNAFAAVDETVIVNDEDNTGDFRSSKFYVLTASDYLETSLVVSVSDIGDISLFTYLAAYGLYKWADDTSEYGNGDGYVNMTELYKFINDYEGDSQHVQMYPYGSTYKLTKVS